MNNNRVCHFTNLCRTCKMKVYVHMYPRQIQSKYIFRSYTQLSRLSFTNIDRELLPIPYYKPSDILGTDVSKHSMERIMIPQFTEAPMGDQESSIVDIKNFPTWYERLDSISSYRLHKDIALEGQEKKIYSSFSKCYSRVLSYYADHFISLTRERLHDLMSKLDNSDKPDHVQKLYIKIDLSEKRLSTISRNTYVIYQRLKVERETLPFYLHQQFLIHLNEGNIAKLLNVYFEFPHPRPLHLKREEFEKFMKLILKIKISGDHKPLLKKIVEVFADIRENGGPISLTPFEDTKYFSLMLNSWESEGMSKSEIYEKVLEIRAVKGPKPLKFVPAMWNCFLTHVPEKSEEILKLMAKEIGLTRFTAEIVLNNADSFDRLCNTLELMKLKNFHMDEKIFALVVRKYIQFGKTHEALELVEKLLDSFQDLTSRNYSFRPLSLERTEVFKLDILNKAFQQLHNEQQEMEHQWLQYKFIPSPFALGELLVSLDREGIIRLLNTMIKHNIPLTHKHALNVIEKIEPSLLHLVLESVNRSRDFNINLKKISEEPKYNTAFYKNYTLQHQDIVLELREIFRKSLFLYDQMVDHVVPEKSRLKTVEQLVSITDYVKKNYNVTFSGKDDIDYLNS